MLIAIDHGNKQVKTLHCEPFISGLLESDVQPFGPNVLKYKGKFYQITDQRIPYRRDKTEDDRFFILTLFAVAGEIEAVGKYFPGIMHIQLAVGLPPAHYGAQYQAFTRYFLGRGTISFSYHGKPFSICIDHADCFPQSYAAAVTMIQALSTIPRALVVDIGGYTLDYIRIKKGEGDLSACDSLENGVILLYNKITSRARAEQDLLLSEPEIDAILQGEATPGLEAAVPVAERCAREFVSDLLSALRERQLELRSGPVIFTGGGSILLQRYLRESGKVAQPMFVEDICANARGYELLYRLSHKAG